MSSGTWKKSDLSHPISSMDMRHVPIAGTWTGISRSQSLSERSVSIFPSPKVRVDSKINMFHVFFLLPFAPRILNLASSKCKECELFYDDFEVPLDLTLNET